jgi:AP2 domain
MTGEWPPETVDHRFGKRADNRWTQLRPATGAQNGLNKGLRSDNTSGCTGVNFHKQIGKWRAYITQHGVQRFLGNYATREAAIAARKAATETLFGEFAPAWTTAEPELRRAA